METLENFSEKIWQVIHVICELWAFLTIVWIICPKYWKESMKFFFRRLFKKMKFIDESSAMGQLLLDDIKLLTGVDRDYNLIISIDKSPLKVDEDFIKVAHKLEEENSVRLEQGISPVYTDLFPYAVHSILPYRKGKYEEPECKITLRKSSYFYSLVSIMFACYYP